MDKKYIGVTIGPIIKTLNNSKKTGQLWGGSYIFSYLMKNIISMVKDKGLAKNIILPYAEKDEVFNEKLGVGRLPDRFIFEAEDNAFEDMGKVVEGVLNNLAEEISEEISKDKEKVKTFLDEYIQIYYLEKELEDSSNPILELSPHLDILELNEKVVAKEEENYLMEFLKNKTVKKSFLVKDAFKKNEVKTLNFKKDKETGELKAYNKSEMNIKSIPEIAVSGTELDEEDIAKVAYKAQKEDKDFYKVLKREYPKIKLNKYHKYIAIVQADGDNIGKVIKNIDKLYGDEDLNQMSQYEFFSKKLFDYAKDAVKIIKSYGGFPIYAGGDDLLFFAPIVGKKSNIFEMLDSISDEFNSKFQVEIQSDTLKKKPSLSFGLSISYYKYPLYEALNSALGLLFGEAKSFKSKDKGKDAIAFKVLKHSGQYYGATVGKSSDSYDKFKKLLKKNINDNNFLSSLQYRIQEDKVLISEALNREGGNLTAYFDNNFDEDAHEEAGEFLEGVKELIEVTYEEVITNEDNNKSKQDGDEKKKIDTTFIDIVHSYLRFIKFLNVEEGENA
ncbi:type III-B CRISPR-associated protein Cas10/Cmr2 [Halonatronum saccharophilum]|uniref:type III-B CRISPR-associated protein Cas10/Cmr2 n=1 Tax=Halonatronum saccharophilum TaxID=150060 RepID=UPI0004870AFC|nr:type III-B CRISPR-associated protein Cas10/Cmr2 [Halonatronum saccharophilum]